MKIILFFVLLLNVVTSYAGFHNETAPYMPFDEIQGFKIMAENPNETKLIHVGVKRNDIVVSVNGRDIASLDDAKKAYDEKDIKEVVVLRNDKPVTLKKGAK